MGERVAVLFTKPAMAGRVKTRLIGELSAQQAAELHAVFVEDLIERLASGRFELCLAWALETVDELPAGPLRAMRQAGDDLGERLYRTLAAVAVEADSVAAIGSDHPELSSVQLEEAFEALESGLADVVLGPARDGGYYLFAARREALRRELFEGIAWSTPSVLEQTLEGCARAGLSTHLLAPASDVDTPQDLERLTVQLANGSVESPMTADLLRSWGRLAAEESR